MEEKKVMINGVERTVYVDGEKTYYPLDDVLQELEEYLIKNWSKDDNRRRRKK